MGQTSAAPEVVSLTPRQRQAVALLVSGLSQKQIAYAMGIELHAVKKLLASARARVKVRSTYRLAYWIGYEAGCLDTVQKDRLSEPRPVAESPAA